MTTVGLYAGSFDPLTLGHLDIVNKACSTFDELYLSIGKNATKKGFFDVNTRKGLMRASIMESDYPVVKQALEMGRLVICDFMGMSIVAHAREIGATHIVRGLRQAGDFNDEFALTGIAGRMDTSVIFTHFICKEKFLHVSSSTARELASLKEDISWLVTPTVERALKLEFEEKARIG